MDTVMGEAMVKDRALVGERRTAIADAAVSLFLKNGFTKTSTKAIAETAGLTVGGMYQYVRSKHDILYLVCERLLQMFLSALQYGDEPQRPASERLTAAIDTYMRLCEEAGEYVQLVYADSRELRPDALQSVKDMDERCVAFFANIIEHGVGTGAFAIEDSWVIARQIVNAGHMWSLKRWAYREHMSHEGYARWQAQFFVSYLVPAGRIQQAREGAAQ